MATIRRHDPDAPKPTMRRFHIRRWDETEILATVEAEDGFNACRVYAYAAPGRGSHGDYWYEWVRD